MPTFSHNTLWSKNNITSLTQQNGPLGDKKSYKSYNTIKVVCSFSLKDNKNIIDFSHFLPVVFEDNRRRIVS